MVRRDALKWLANAGALIGLPFGAASAQSSFRPKEDVAERVRAAFPYPVVSVPGKDALSKWEEIRAAGKAWPVIVGNDASLNMLMSQFSLDDPKVFPPPPGAFAAPPELLSPQQIIAAAKTINVAAELRKLHGIESGIHPLEIEEGVWPKPGTMAPMTLTRHRDILTQEFLPKVNIVTLPTRNPAEVPAYLRWGGWNACPLPQVHVAMHTDWAERHGAEIVAIGGAVINLRVKRRPTSREEALALAKELYPYCEDLILQGYGDFAPLAMALMESDYWYFWWD